MNKKRNMDNCTFHDHWSFSKLSEGKPQLNQELNPACLWSLVQTKPENCNETYRISVHLQVNHGAF